MKAESGFTLLEVLLSIVILSIISISFMGFFSSNMTSSSKNEDQYTASVLAREVLTKFKLSDHIIDNLENKNIIEKDTSSGEIKVLQHSISGTEEINEVIDLDISLDDRFDIKVSFVEQQLLLQLNVEIYDASNPTKLLTHTNGYIYNINNVSVNELLSKPIYTLPINPDTTPESSSQSLVNVRTGKPEDVFSSMTLDNGKKALVIQNQGGTFDNRENPNGEGDILYIPVSNSHQEYTLSVDVKFEFAPSNNRGGYGILLDGYLAKESNDYNDDFGYRLDNGYMLQYDPDPSVDGVILRKRKKGSEDRSDRDHYGHLKWHEIGLTNFDVNSRHKIDITVIQDPSDEDSTRRIYTAVIKPENHSPSKKIVFYDNSISLFTVQEAVGYSIENSSEFVFTTNGRIDLETINGYSSDSQKHLGFRIWSNRSGDKGKNKVTIYNAN